MATRVAALVLVSVLVVSACGFHPVYEEHQQSGFDADLASVKVGLIPNRLGQELAITLRDDFNPTGATVPTRYTLEVNLSTQRSDLGIAATATALRSEMIVYAYYKITDAKTNQQVAAGSTRSVSAFDVLQDAYATQVAQNGATERALREVADDLRERILVFIRQQRAKGVS
jgi:LPS-assembly lipoprotein